MPRKKSATGSHISLSLSMAFCATAFIGQRSLRNSNPPTNRLQPLGLADLLKLVPRFDFARSRMLSEAGERENRVHLTAGFPMSYRLSAQALGLLSQLTEKEEEFLKGTENDLEAGS